MVIDQCEWQWNASLTESRVTIFEEGGVIREGSAGETKVKAR